MIAMSSIHPFQDPQIPADAIGSPLIRVHIYAAPLLRMGLEEILDDTRFVVSDTSPEITAEPYEDQAPALFIVALKYGLDAVTEFIAQVKTQRPAARIIVLADQCDIKTVIATQQAGADGFCLTSSTRDVLIRSIELVMLGETIVPSELIRAMADGGAQSLDFLHEPNFDAVADRPPSKPLSSREIEVLFWLKEGAPNKVIARKLNLAEATVKVHVKKILRKIGVCNRAQAALWAASHLPSGADAFT